MELKKMTDNQLRKKNFEVAIKQAKEIVQKFSKGHSLVQKLKELRDKDDI